MQNPTSTQNISEDIRLIELALEANPTSGEWGHAKDFGQIGSVESDNDPLVQVQTLTRVKGLYRNAQRDVDAQYIASVSPDRVTRLIKEVKQSRWFASLAEDAAAGAEQQMLAYKAELEVREQSQQKSQVALLQSIRDLISCADPGRDRVEIKKARALLKEHAERKNSDLIDPTLIEKESIASDQKTLVAELVQSLKWATERIQSEICEHLETHRGGAIWTICSDCGKKWADDEGGFKSEDPPAGLSKALDLLARIEKSKNSS